MPLWKMVLGLCCVTIFVIFYFLNCYWFSLMLKHLVRTISGSKKASHETELLSQKNDNTNDHA
jgi:hypothetical protein